LNVDRLRDLEAYLGELRRLFEVEYRRSVYQGRYVVRFEFVRGAIHLPVIYRHAPVRLVKGSRFHCRMCCDYEKGSGFLIRMDCGSYLDFFVA